ncbi:TPA: hypothetical protein DCE37_07940 [Candidatus Latescibacteria bacterium]|nr:hypothetical protein [Candidatus Latescibacterota bacterium]|tara:strand:- start:900 stop:1112 length:213 start_codon:yes stop_codon:yes gene_type:complete
MFQELSEKAHKLEENSGKIRLTTPFLPFIFLTSLNDVYCCISFIYNEIQGISASTGLYHGWQRSFGRLED